MRFRDDINKIMDSVDINVDNEMKNKIINKTTRSSERKRSFVGARKTVAVAMAAVLCIGTTVLGVGAVTGGWNNLIDKVAIKQIEIDEQQKTKLMKNGYVDAADDEKVSDTTSGITVSLVQTIADRKGMYIYLAIKSENIKLKKGSYFDYVKVNVEGVGSIERFVDDISLLSDHEGIMQIYGSIDTTKFDKLDAEGKKIEVVLGDLQYTDEVEYETLNNAEWKISWIGKGCDDSKIVNLSESINLNGIGIKLHCIEITPLTVLIEYDCIDGADIDLIKIPFAVVMNDGTKYEYKEDGSIFMDDYMTIYGSGYNRVMGVDEQLYDHTFIRIKNPIDINEIDYIEVCGTKYDVE